MKKYWLILFLIVVLAFVVRIYKLGTLPLGTHPDEASWGYNAYSIIQTGKDEHGIKYPLIFKAFGDQKLPVFTYSIIPFILKFGLNNFAIRFPAAIIGTTICVLIYWLLRQIKFSVQLSLLGALIAATNPWLIFLSRVFTPDSTFGLFFLILGINLFLFSKSKNKQVFGYLAAISFAISWYCYIAYRVISTLVLICLLLLNIYKKNNKFLTVKLFLTFLLVISPLLWLTFSNNGTARFAQVASTPTLGMVLRIDENRYFCTQKLPRVLCYFNDNKLKSYIQTLSYRYIKTLSPNYLFLEGDKDNLFLNVEQYGMFYFWLVIFYLFGLLYYAQQFLNHKLKQIDLLVLLGLFITPLPALLVNDPMKTRLSALLPFVVIIIVKGISILGNQFKNIQRNLFYTFVAIGLLLFQVLFVIDFLSIHIPKNEMSYYVPQIKLIKYLGTIDKNTQIYIHGIDEAIVLYAYINKVNPNLYQKTVKRTPVDNIGFAHATDVENIHLTKLDINQFYCAHKNHQETILYTTNQNLIEPKIFSKAQKIIYSENKVHKFQYVYNLDKINKDIIICP